MAEHTGWLLDLYDDPQDGLVLWLLDETGERRRLRQDFPVTFYAAGDSPRLRLLWRWLRGCCPEVKLSRSERRDLFSEQPCQVLAATVPAPGQLASIFARAAQEFPDLTYYDSDIKLPLRHAARWGTFPLAHCRVQVDAEDRVLDITPLDTPWELDPPPPPLRIMAIQPDEDPGHAPPRRLTVQCQGLTYTLALQPERALLINLAALLRRHDPDLLLCGWGDTWLLPLLLDLSAALEISLPLNRESTRPPIRRKQHSYFSYGQVIYMGPQVHLLGRWHLDVFNAILFHDYNLDGVLEMARVSSLPVQVVARSSPGSGISAMQIVTALRQGVLVPWHKQQPEDLKSALDLLQADQGGLVYQPTPGLHRDVAEIDFVSMYPSIMVRFNISPETARSQPDASPSGEPGGDAASGLQRVPELGLWIDLEKRGLVPETLAPLLGKRIQLKDRLNYLKPWDPRRARYKAQASAHKWLLVTCFGYLGYKNARFGRIEAHEAVTAYGREALLRAKEAAEDLGFTVLHLYVDGMWIKKDGCRQVPDFQPVLDEIVTRTGLPVALDGIYRWVAFLSSRVNPRVPVPNRYFGVFQDGSLKMRGIEVRRGDTPAFISATQQEVLELLAQAPDAEALPRCLPEVVRLLRSRLGELRQGRLPVQALLASQKLSRRLDEYRTPSPVARATAQLESIGKFTEPGEHVRFVYMRGWPGVHAWDLETPPDLDGVDVARYTELFVRAMSTVLQPLGVEEARLRNWLFANAAYDAPPGFLPPPGSRRLPLLTVSIQRS